MTEPSEKLDHLYLRFRDEHEPVPMARNLEHVGQLIEERVKPGLPELLSRVDLEPVEYAGFALATYLYPQQRLDFKHPELAEALKLSLVGIGMDVASGPARNPQDLYLEFGNAFDVRMVARRYPEIWRECVYTQWRPEGREDEGTYSDATFVLGPYVRMYRDDAAPRSDEFNQPANAEFSLRHALSVTGEVLLPALIDRYPSLKSGLAIPTGYTPEMLTHRFALTPADTTWADWYLGLVAHEELIKSHRGGDKL